MRMYRYHMPVRPAQPQHTVRACACARHAHAPHPRCAPREGSARRSLRRTAEVEQRDARHDESRSAGHARCAAPDRPVVQPVRPDFLAVQAPARCCRLRKNGANQGLRMRYADPTQCALWPSRPSAAWSLADSVHCVEARPNQRHPIACAALARRRLACGPEILPVHFWPRRTAVRRRSPRPTAPCSNPRAMPRG